MLIGIMWNRNIALTICPSLPSGQKLSNEYIKLKSENEKLKSEYRELKTENEMLRNDISILREELP